MLGNFTFLQHLDAFINCASIHQLTGIAQGTFIMTSSFHSERMVVFNVFLQARPDDNKAEFLLVRLHQVGVPAPFNESPLNTAKRALKFVQNKLPILASRLSVGPVSYVNYSFYEEKVPEMVPQRGAILHLAKPSNRATVKKVTKATAAIEHINKQEASTTISAGNTSIN